MQELGREIQSYLIWSEKRRKETAQGDLRSLRSRSVSWVLFCVERDRATEERERERLRKEREPQRKREIASTEKRERRESLLVSVV